MFSFVSIPICRKFVDHLTGHGVRLFEMVAIRELTIQLSYHTNANRAAQYLLKLAEILE
jgi:hypothetical protein